MNSKIGAEAERKEDISFAELHNLIHSKEWKEIQAELSFFRLFIVVLVEDVEQRTTQEEQG